MNEQEELQELSREKLIEHCKKQCKLNKGSKRGYEHNSDKDYSDSLYWTEEDSLALTEEREAYIRGYIQAINDLIFN